MRLFHCDLYTGGLSLCLACEVLSVFLSKLYTQKLGLCFSWLVWDVGFYWHESFDFPTQHGLLVSKGESQGPLSWKKFRRKENCKNKREDEIRQSKDIRDMWLKFPRTRNYVLEREIRKREQAKGKYELRCCMKGREEGIWVVIIMVQLSTIYVWMSRGSKLTKWVRLRLKAYYIYNKTYLGWVMNDDTSLSPTHCKLVQTYQTKYCFLLLMRVDLESIFHRGFNF